MKKRVLLLMVLAVMLAAFVATSVQMTGGCGTANGTFPCG
jgi:hypothetical protein